MRDELIKAARPVLKWLGGTLLVVFVLVWIAAPSAVTIAAGVTVVLFVVVRYCLLVSTPHPLLAALIGALAIGGAAGPFLAGLPRPPSLARLIVVLLAYLVIYLFGATWLLGASRVLHEKPPAGRWSAWLGWGGLAAWSALFLLGAIAIGMGSPVR